jgi:hypothetical protein
MGISAAGCVSQRAAVPPPPVPDTHVYFYPTQRQSAEQQDRDRYECNNWAVQQSGFDPSAPRAPPHLRYLVSTGEPPPGSAVAAGALTGAVVGAAVSRPWEAGGGALIGALAGAALGGIAEGAAAEDARAQAAANANAVQAAQIERKALNFRRAMSACLEARGYSVR